MSYTRTTRSAAKGTSPRQHEDAAPSAQSVPPFLPKTWVLPLPAKLPALNPRARQISCLSHALLDCEGVWIVSAAWMCRRPLHLLVALLSSRSIAGMTWCRTHRRMISFHGAQTAAGMQPLPIESLAFHLGHLSFLALGLRSIGTQACVYPAASRCGISPSVQRSCCPSTSSTTISPLLYGSSTHM